MKLPDGWTGIKTETEFPVDSGTTIIVSCQRGYTNIGSTVVTCNNYQFGDFSYETKPSCNRTAGRTNQLNFYKIWGTMRYTGGAAHVVLSFQMRAQFVRTHMDKNCVLNFMAAYYQLNKYRLFSQTLDSRGTYFNNRGIKHDSMVIFQLCQNFKHGDI